MVDLKLRQYQQEAIDRIVKDKRLILADPTGSGKSAMAIGSVLACAGQPCLVVAPAIVVENWRREILMWDPKAKVQVLSKKKDLPTPGMEWIVCSYGILDSQVPALQVYGLGFVVFDEAAALKSPKTKRTRAARDVSMNVDRRLLMTATPVMNRPAELGSLLGVMGELYRFGGWSKFTERYCDAKKRKLWGTNRVIWDISGASNLDELRVKMEPLMIRRSKLELLPELPAVQFVPVYVDVTNRADYNRAEKDVKAWLVEKAMVSDADPMEAAMRIAAAQALEQNGAESMVRLTETRKLAAQGKVGPTLEWLKQWMEDNPGESILVFGHHSEALTAVYDGLVGAGVNARLIKGGVGDAERQMAIDSFQQGNVRVLCCSIKATGIGITLTRASSCVFLEETWTPADTEQAVGRMSRIGQTAEKVVAYQMMGKNTVDEYVHDALGRKQRLIAQLIG